MGLFRKTLVTLAVFCLGISSVAAQQANSLLKKQEERKLTSVILSVSMGTNIHTGGNEHPECFATRADVATQFDMRMNVFLSDCWSVYGDFGLTFFKLQKKSPGLFEEIFDALFDVALRFNPSLGVGASYMAEFGRFNLMPRAGLGYQLYAGDSNHTKQMNSVTYKSNVRRSSFFANAGCAFEYRLTEMWGLLFDVNYRYPLQSAKAKYTVQEADTPPVKQNWSSRSWTNDLSISLGIQLHFGGK